MRLVRSLVKAIIGDYGNDGVRVSVIDGARPPEDIIAATRSQPPLWANYPAIEPHLAFADWRNDIICLTSLGAVTNQSDY